MKFNLIPLLFTLFIHTYTPSERTYSEIGHLASPSGCQPEDGRLFFEFTDNEKKNLPQNVSEDFLKLKNRTGTIIISNGYFHSPEGKQFLHNRNRITIPMCEPQVDTPNYINRDNEILTVRLQYRILDYERHKPSYNSFSNGNSMSYYVDCDTSTELHIMNIDTQKVIMINNIMLLKDSL